MNAKVVREAVGSMSSQLDKASRLALGLSDSDRQIVDVELKRFRILREYLNLFVCVRDFTGSTATTTDVIKLATAIQGQPLGKTLFGKLSGEHDLRHSWIAMDRLIAFLRIGSDILQAATDQ